MWSSTRKTEILQRDKSVDKASKWASWIKSHQESPIARTVILIAAYYSIWRLSIIPHLVTLQAWLFRIIWSEPVTFKKKIRIRISHVSWMFEVLKQNMHNTKSDSNSWFAIKALADRMQGSVNHTFMDQRHQDDSSVHRPYQLLHISRCPLI